MCSAQEKLDKLRIQYQAHLADYHDRLNALWLNATADKGKTEEIRLIAHKLAGSGQAYGFRELSQVAKEFESVLDASNNFSKKELRLALTEPFNELLGVLKHCLEKQTPVPFSEQSLVTPNDTEQAGINVLIFDDDEHFSAKLTQTLANYGYQATIETDITKLETTIREHEPLALLVDMNFYGQRFAGANQVRLWRQKDGAPLPVIFISQHDSFDLRLAAVRAGGNHFLTKPLDVQKLIALLRSELNLAPAEPYRVMIVDDDRYLLDLYDSILTDAGYSVSTGTSAEAALSLLDQSQPELILVDVNMPNCDGIELGRIIRQHEEFASIPLLFISASNDTDIELACARLTNDDFIHKPIEPWRLLMMVKSRVVKGRQLRTGVSNLTSSNADIAPDSLTGLGRLVHLKSAIDKTLKSSTDNTIALLKIDIRNFHTINNLHGQHFGDQVLQQVAWQLTQYLQPNSQLCREHNDEFMLFTADFTSQQALELYLTKLVGAINEISLISSHGPATLSVDAGVALATGKTVNAVELIDKADMALFKAKRLSGPKVVYFDQSVREEQKYRFNLEQNIKKALDKDEFIAVYQPIICVKTGALFGFEALARWDHPEQGLLTPNEFIPPMEEYGIISDLTASIIKQVTRQLSVWQSSHPDLYISFNLSALDIQQPKFLKVLDSQVEACNLDAKNLTLEITESLLLSDWQKIGPMLDALSESGFSLALDDFGTGYSSLSYLYRINADKLKIDRSFLQYWSETGDARLLNIIVKLGHLMHMQVIAEGIEQQEELDFLRRIGCDQYQGFLSARPMLAEQVVKAGWLTKH